MGIFILIATLSAEWFLIKPTLRRYELQRLAGIDGVYGLAALWVLTSGLLMAYMYGKGSAFYSQQGLLYVKLGIFSVVGIISIWPTVYYLKNRKGDPEQLLIVPTSLSKLIFIQAFLLLSMPFWAVLMAQGGF